MTHKEQGCFFLNAYWEERNEKAEEVWEFVKQFGVLDKQKGNEGYALDEFESAQFLESIDQTMTVLKRRAVLKEIDINTDHRMSLIEYLVFKFKVDIKELIERPQGLFTAYSY